MSPPSPINSLDGGVGTMCERRPPPPRRPKQSQHPPTRRTAPSAAVATLPGELSPRADLWAVLVITSATVVASLSMAMEGSSLELVAVAAASLALAIALLAAARYRFCNSRERMTTPLRNGGRMTMELALAAFALVLWCLVAGVVQGGNGLATEGLGIANSNLFYSSWASFALASYMVADLLTVDDVSGVVPYDHLPTNQAVRSWILLFAASLVLISFNLAASTGDTCAGEVLMDTSVCQRAIAGILLGFLGLLTSIAYLLVERAFPKRARPLGMALSLFDTIVFAINAAIMTSPGSPGFQPSSLYWASWTCFALALYLCVCHVEACAASGTSAEERLGGEHVHLMQQMHPSHNDTVSKSTASHTTASESTYEEEEDDSYSSGSSASTEEYSEPQLAALLPAMDDRRSHEDRSRLASQGAFQAREQEKQLIFEKMSQAPTTTNVPGSGDRGATTSGVPSNTVTTAEGFERNLTQYLAGLQLPKGLNALIIDNHFATDSRLWLLDNSHNMIEADASKPSGDIDVVQQIGPISRWDELRECVAFHAKMASRCWIPTKFWLINKPGPNVGEQKFSLCWKAPIDIPEEAEGVQRIMTKASPGPRKTALAVQVTSVEKGVAREKERLEGQGKYIVFVMCTHGVATDATGRGGPTLLQEFQESLAKLSSLPVKVVVRLCTGDEKVLTAYDDMFGGDNLDVMSDYWREAAKVHRHNPWLTYGIGIHRLREAGLAWGLIEGLNCRPLRPDEIHTFCTRLLLSEGSGEGELPHPRKWLAFMRALRKLLKEEKPVWNPIAKRQCPWINLTKLHSMYGAEGQNIPVNT